MCITYDLYTCIHYSSHVWLCLGYIITVMFTTHIHCMHVYIMYNCMNYVCICINNIIITCMVRIRTYREINGIPTTSSMMLYDRTRPHSRHRFHHIACDCIMWLTHASHCSRVKHWYISTTVYKKHLNKYIVRRTIPQAGLLELHREYKINIIK